MTFAKILTITGGALVLFASFLELWLERVLSEISAGVQAGRVEDKIDWLLRLAAREYCLNPKNQPCTSIAIDFKAALAAFSPVPEPRVDKQHAVAARIRISIQLLGGLLVIVGTVLDPKA